ncbi:hypothetical protein ACLB2K_067770 [Fragaria x ananassa]
MNQNVSALMIGLAGATITLSAYSQTVVSSTQCITVGLLLLMFGLVVKEGGNLAPQTLTTFRNLKKLNLDLVRPAKFDLDQECCTCSRADHLLKDFCIKKLKKLKEDSQMAMQLKKCFRNWTFSQLKSLVHTLRNILMPPKVAMK